MAWTSPRTWVAGEKPTATTLNTHIRDNFKAIGDAWGAYTPVMAGTGFVAGNATLTGRYMQAGKLVFGSFNVIIGSTTTLGSGGYNVTLPVTTAGFGFGCGTGGVYDISASASRMRLLYLFSTTQLTLQDTAGANVTGASPFALATGDIIGGSFMYEAA